MIEMEKILKSLKKKEEEIINKQKKNAQKIDRKLLNKVK